MRRAGNHGGDVPDLSNVPQNPTDLRYIQGLGVPTGYEIHSDDGTKLLAIIEPAPGYEVAPFTLTGGFAILYPSRYHVGQYRAEHVDYDTWYNTLERETVRNKHHAYIMRQAAVTRQTAMQIARAMSSMDALYYSIEGG